MTSKDLKLVDFIREKLRIDFEKTIVDYFPEECHNDYYHLIICEFIDYLIEKRSEAMVNSIMDRKILENYSGKTS